MHEAQGNLKLWGFEADHGNCGNQVSCQLPSVLQRQGGRPAETWDFDVGGADLPRGQPMVVHAASHTTPCNCSHSSLTVCWHKPFLNTCRKHRKKQILGAQDCLWNLPLESWAVPGMGCSPGARPGFLAPCSSSALQGNLEAGQNHSTKTAENSKFFSIPPPWRQHRLVNSADQNAQEIWNFLRASPQASVKGSMEIIFILSI